MKYNFDEIVNRHDTYSMKWGGAPLFKMFGMEAHWNDETIPMMVADMDFKCPPAIQAAMHRVADFGIYGYTTHFAEPRYNQSIVDWYKRRYDTDIKPEWILYSDGSVSAINCAMNTFLNPGEGVIITPPVYGHFNDMIDGETCHKPVHCQLINDDGYYTMDWADFEAKCAVPTNRMFILCSPANPIGRVWTAEELARVADICKRNHVLLVADEIHSDILRRDVKHIPILKATEDYSNIILVTGINKSFNVAGLHCANVIIPDDNLREVFRSQFGMKMPTPFAVAAVVAAYNDSEEWLEALNDYLDANIDYAVGFIWEHMPNVRVRKPEGTYMLWLDFSAYGLTGAEIHKRIYEDANVMLQDGRGHDPSQGECFQRMCITLPRPQLEIALKRIAEQFRP